MRDRLSKFVFLSLAFLSMVLNLEMPANSDLPLLVHKDDYAGYNDCWGYTAPDGREYALLGTDDGTSIIDITAAEQGIATEIAFIPGASSGWRDIKTYRHYAYVVNENSGGIHIIDLSALPDTAALVATYTPLSASHNIFIDEQNGILYAEGTFSEPVWVLSLNDPLNPELLTTFGIACHDVYAHNNIAYISEGGNGSFGIYDVSDPGQPQLLQRLEIPSAGYCHNAWATSDGRFLMTTEETSGKSVKLWDISDLDNIVLRSTFLAANQLAHNVHIKRNYAYISHYESGLKVADISVPTIILRVGQFDTPDAWGTYPYFSSGKVLISDIVSGLYVVYFEGAVDAVTAIEDTPQTPESFSVKPNYPNPFNPSTTIEYSLIERATVRLEIFSAAGQKVRTLQNSTQQPGNYKLVWDGRNDSGQMVSSGTYFYRVTAGSFSKMFKMTFVR